MPLEISEQHPGWVQDSRGGLLVPVSVVRQRKASYDAKRGAFILPAEMGTVHHTPQGTKIAYDSYNSFLRYPPYGSWEADLINLALGRGHTLAGAMSDDLTMLEAIISKRQQMASTWQVICKGPASEAEAVAAVISMANDSDIGASKFISSYIGALDTFLVGACGAKVPIHRDVDSWSSYGLKLVPIGDQTEGQEIYYTIDSTPRVRLENQGLWMLDGLRITPTGNPDYPFWYTCYSHKLERAIHVLVENLYGFQILQSQGADNGFYKGYGSCGIWRYRPWVVKGAAISRVSWEALSGQWPDAIVYAVGLDDPDEFKEKYDEHLAGLKKNNLLANKVFMLGFESESAKIVVLPIRQIPEGYTWEEFENARISNLAASFHMNETQLRLKLGEGALTQSGVAEAMESESFLPYMRLVIQSVFNMIGPRTLVSVNWLSDRQKRVQVDIFDKWAGGIEKLNRSYDEPVLSTDEIRHTYSTYFGMELPSQDSGEATTLVVDRTNLWRHGVIVHDRDGHWGIGYKLSSVGGYSQRRLWTRWAVDGYVGLGPKRNLAEDIIVPLGFDEPLPTPDDTVIDDDLLSFVEAAVGMPSEWDEEEKAWVIDGATLTSEQMVTLRDGFLDEMISRIQAYSMTLDPLLDNPVSVQEWVVEMEGFVRSTWIGAFLLGIGGASRVTPVALSWLSTQIEGQVGGYLYPFAQEIADARHSLAYIVNRAGLYGSAGVMAYERSRGFAYDIDLPAYPGDGSTICKANDRCWWELVVDENRVLAFWRRRDDVESCETCEIYERRWNPFVVENRES